MNDGIILSTLRVKNLFKLVEKKAQYLRLNTSEALCTTVTKTVILCTTQEHFADWGDYERRYEISL